MGQPAPPAAPNYPPPRAAACPPPLGGSAHPGPAFQRSGLPRGWRAKTTEPPSPGRRRKSNLLWVGKFN
eukprot:2777895-Pyramimonas_sp.AAC.1